MGIYLFAMAMCMGGTAWCILAWAVKDGQFKNLDDHAGHPLEAEEKYV